MICDLFVICYLRFEILRKLMKIFSGIQPSGTLHIGNYLGAIKNWVKLQKDNDCVFCIVDLHAITVAYDPKKMPQRIFELAVDLLACGIDPVRDASPSNGAGPKKSILFVQSDVKEHAELGWILSTITPLAELERMTQYKDKTSQHKENINAGLLCYPALMAADILLYQTQGVPVGQDQKQHVELTRTIARKFNNTFGEIFIIPKPLIFYNTAAKVMSLSDPTKKMSKSAGSDSYIALIDEPEIIAKKLAKAVTDPARKRITDKGHPEKCNIFTLHQLFSPAEQISQIDKDCRSAKIGCVECKKILSANIAQELAPFRAKRQELLVSPQIVKDILANGAEQAQNQASQMVHKVKQAMGLYI